MMDHIAPMSVTRKVDTEGGPEVYGVIAEFANQGPLLLESEGQGTSYENALAQCQRLGRAPHILRVAIVKLVHVNGNELILHDMERMQK